MEQKDADINDKSKELRAFKVVFSSLQRRLEIKDREIEAAKKEMKQSAGSGEDEIGQEISRMQVMLLDLKSTRVDLLEKLDDAQHEVENLKNELSKRKTQ